LPDMPARRLADQSEKLNASMFSALPPTTDIHQARTPCLKSAGAMNGWSATTK